MVCKRGNQELWRNIRVIPLSLQYWSVSVGRDSVVGIEAYYWLDGPEIESREGERFIAPVRTDPGAHTTSCVMGTESLSQG